MFFQGCPGWTALGPGPRPGRLHMGGWGPPGGRFSGPPPHYKPPLHGRSISKGGRTSPTRRTHPSLLHAPAAPPPSALVPLSPTSSRVVHGRRQWSLYRVSRHCSRRVSPFRRSQGQQGRSSSSSRADKKNPPAAAAQELTLDAASAARNSSRHSSSRPLDKTQIKRLLDSRNEREVLEGLRRVISVRLPPPPFVSLRTLAFS